MLRLLSFEAQGRKDFWKTSEPCHVGIHWIALTEYSQMSIHVTGVQSFFRVLHHFGLVKLVTSSIRVKLSRTQSFRWRPTEIWGREVSFHFPRVGRKWGRGQGEGTSEQEHMVDCKVGAYRQPTTAQGYAWINPSETRDRFRNHIHAS